MLGFCGVILTLIIQNAGQRRGNDALGHRFNQPARTIRRTGTNRRMPRAGADDFVDFRPRDTGIVLLQLSNMRIPCVHFNPESIFLLPPLIEGLVAALLTVAGDVALPLGGCFQRFLVHPAGHGCTAPVAVNNADRAVNRPREFAGEEVRDGGHIPRIAGADTLPMRRGFGCNRVVIPDALFRDVEVVHQRVVMRRD